MPGRRSGLLPLLITIAVACGSSSNPEKLADDAPIVKLDQPQPEARRAKASRPDAAVPSPEDFIDVASLKEEFLLDMRYAGANNFAKKAVYPKARCLVRAPVATALLQVQESLRVDNLQLLIWDCYRPFHVQELFWELVPDARYVARPQRENGQPHRGSKHNRGAAVDVSLARVDGTPLNMPTDHDDFSERAHRDAKGVDTEAQNNARRLAAAMEAAGFAGIDTEWWHFDFAGWQEYPLSDAPL